MGYLLDLNTTSFLNLAAAVVPTLKRQGAGHVVTVGRLQQPAGRPTWGACAAKSALQRLTEALSAELKMDGINVNCVLPTVLDTPDNRAAMPDANPATWVQPKDFAEVIGFLISGGARAIHGAAIPVAGRSVAEGIWGALSSTEYEYEIRVLISYIRHRQIDRRP